MGIPMIVVTVSPPGDHDGTMVPDFVFSGLVEARMKGSFAPVINGSIPALPDIIHLYYVTGVFYRMKILIACIVICAFLLVLMTGCTSLPASRPVTPVTTEVPVTNNPALSPPIIDPLLVGTWYLKMMTGQGGMAPVEMTGPQITAVFTNQSNIIGSSGCNNYNGHYTLTGKVLPQGNGIMVGPLASSTMYCPNATNNETVYFRILQAATTYTVNIHQELTITDNSEETLVYQRAPYSPAFVRKGI